MALATYDDLCAAIADWLNRSDLTDQIPTFISLSEAKFNRNLRVREMLSRRYTKTSSEFLSLPPDFLETYQLQLPPDSSGKSYEPFRFVGPDELALLKSHNATGRTRVYTVIDGAFEIFPVPTTGTVELHLTYYAKIPSLSSDNETNWLLTKAPDLYLFTSLSHAAPYLNNDERIPVWSQMASSAFDELTQDSERAMRSRTQLTARRRGF